MTIRIGLSTDGTVVTIAAGDVLELALPENPTTGYRWALDPPSAGSRLIDDRMERGDSTPTAGAGATRVLAILVEQAGALHAQLRREWETQPIQSFTVRVELA